MDMMLNKTEGCEVGQALWNFVHPHHIDSLDHRDLLNDLIRLEASNPFLDNYLNDALGLNALTDSDPLLKSVFTMNLEAFALLLENIGFIVNAQLLKTFVSQEQSQLLADLIGRARCQYLLQRAPFFSKEELSVLALTVQEDLTQLEGLHRHLLSCGLRTLLIVLRSFHPDAQNVFALKLDPSLVDARSSEITDEEQSAYAARSLQLLKKMHKEISCD